MCGIVGYTGGRRAAPLLIAGLERLEYRGYDSAGIAVWDGGRLCVVRKKGRVSELAEARELEGTAGIGHTRWATHGAPSERNAHPHVYGGIAVVHNGIVENAAELIAECRRRGEEFHSETDSEVIAHLIARAYRGDLLRAVREGVSRLSGSYAVAVMREGSGDIVCARMRSPLIVGEEKDGLFVASDLPAIAGEGVRAYTLEDGEFALLSGPRPRFYDGELGRIEKKAMNYRFEEDRPDLCGFRHFMRKEMAEIPAVLAVSAPDLSPNGEFSELYEVLCQTEQVQIVACGTAYHAALCAKHVIEAVCRVPTDASVASEYRYRDPIVPPRTLAVAVSQSGETADTLAAARLARERGAYLVAVTNVPYSSLTRIAQTVLPTSAGREVAVAATKSFNAQLRVLYALAEALARAKGREAPPLGDLSSAAREALVRSEDVRAWTPYFLGAQSVYFIGRGADRYAAQEGSLKLKEISYLPSEGYAAGELKHGTLALIGENTPVVAVLTQAGLAEKTMNAVHEVAARGANVFLVTSLAAYAEERSVKGCVLLPACAEVYSPILSVIPLQALAYYVSVARGNDPDKPRNLAKSVTVE